MWTWVARRKSASRPEADAPEPGSARAGEELAALPAALPRIAAEFARARRYERPVTIGVLAAGPNGTNAAASAPRPADGTGNPAAPSLALAARSAVREIDIVSCEVISGCCIVVMPEIGGEEGRRALERMCQACANRLGRPVRGGVAVYPRDGWTFLDLVDAAKRTGAFPREAGRVETTRGLPAPAVQPEGMSSI
jgi:hypothetical protein